MSAPKFYLDEYDDAKLEIEETGSSTYMADTEGFLYALIQNPDTGELTFENMSTDETFTEAQIVVLDE